MTRKIYRSAMGKEVDLGALLLQNEHVRAVGNMNVNARGDKLDSENRVVETRSQTVQKQYKKQTVNPSRMTPHTSNVHARKERAPAEVVQETRTTEEPVESVDLSELDTFADLPEDDDVVVEKDLSEHSNPLKGGLAGAIARSREVRQEKEKSLREMKQDQPLKRI